MIVKCAWCEKEFKPEREDQIVCSLECSLRYAKKQKEERRKIAAQERNRIRLLKNSILSLADLNKKAQQSFNKFIRQRDCGKTCVSCGKVLNNTAIGGSFDCGHYLSIKTHPWHRFNELNAHAQCKYCNKYLHGNAAGYRKGLIERIGLEAVENLENVRVDTVRSKDKLRFIEKEYVAKYNLEKKEGKTWKNNRPFVQKIRTEF